MKKMTLKVRGNYQTLSDKSLLVLAQTVERAMTANPNFNDVGALLGALSTILEKYKIDLASSNKRGSPEDTAIKNISRKDLEKAISELAFYVNKASKGFLPFLLSSGLILTKAKRPLSLPTKVEGLVLKDSLQKGQMILNFQAQKNVRIYNYRYTKDRDASGNILWTGKVFTTTSSKKNLISSVKPAAIYYISVQALNSIGIGDWSDAVSWIVR